MKRHPQFGLYGEKARHRADKTNIETGAVSALCFKKPRAIDLKIASWTIRDEAVTCKQCLRIIEEGGK